MSARCIIILIALVLASCNGEKVDTSKINMSKFDEFKAKDKFIKDSTLFYPGLSNPALQTVLNQKINQVADSFKGISASTNPTAADYQRGIEQGLALFDDIYLDLDTEDRERVCYYFEDLMNIVGLESSGGRLNNFMYGFDPTDYKK